MYVASLLSEGTPLEGGKNIGSIVCAILSVFRYSSLLCPLLLLLLLPLLCSLWRDGRRSRSPPTMRDRGDGVVGARFCSRAWRCSLLFQFVWFVSCPGAGGREDDGVGRSVGGWFLPSTFTQTYTQDHNRKHRRRPRLLRAMLSLTLRRSTGSSNKHSKCCAHTVICQTFFLKHTTTTTTCCRTVSFVALKTVATDRASN